jgi:hypothetical protein
MIIKFDTPTKGNNTGSAGAFVGYLGKEDKINPEGPEAWFSPSDDDYHPSAVRTDIDRDHQGIGKKEGKFATGSLNPTEEEWNALGSNEEERSKNFKTWIQKEFIREFADNFKKKDKEGKPIPIAPENIKIYFKMEHDRHYTGHDPEVREKKKKQGTAKEGFNRHCHFIIARKTKDGKSRISPTTNNRKEFDRDILREKTEQSFDKYNNYDRSLEESYRYMNTMINGNADQKIEMIQLSSLAELSRMQAQKKTHEKEPIIAPKLNEQEVEKERSIKATSIEKIKRNNEEKDKDRGMGMGW